MVHSAKSDPRLRADAVPLAVRRVLERLGRHGCQAFLVGGCVRDLLRGIPASDCDVSTSAPPATVLEIFERAVPIGLRHGTVMVPTSHGPVDVTSFRAGPRCEDDLARRDFTINAVAWQPLTGEWIDPFGGAADLRARRLRAVGCARDRFREDPLRALRAARLVAALALEPDAEIEPAMREARKDLARVAPERIRRELEALLLAPDAASGLRLLRRSGIEADLAPGVSADAEAVVSALPLELVSRLTGWLRGGDAAGIVARLRFPRHTCRRVVQLLQLHPVERQIRANRHTDVARLMRRVGEEGIEFLLALREAELSAGAGRETEPEGTVRQSLAWLRGAMGELKRSGMLALRRADLAIDGREVMRLLGCGPGPNVGEALRYLTDRVIEAPGRNTPEALRALLAEWRRQQHLSVPRSGA